jgi:peroxiredoxin family protein
MEQPLNLVLFSGTDDKLQAAAVLTAGAAALGKPVNVFLQYWALDAFRKERIDRDHGLAPEAGEEGRAAVDGLRAAGQASWAETLRQAKDLGEVDVQACSLSMDLLRICPTSSTASKVSPPST